MDHVRMGWMAEEEGRGRRASKETGWLAGCCSGAVDVRRTRGLMEFGLSYLANRWVCAVRGGGAQI